jgi:DNA (cytosine-5)-methyltransferase 1
MVEAIKVAKPKVFVAENVKALFFKNNAKSLETLKRDFGKLGYNLDVSLYNAADYGVPQTRERVLIIGTRDRPMKRIAPTLEKTNWVTASAAIDDLKDKERDEEFAHIWSYANRSPHQGDRRLKMDRPGYTIRAECHGNIQFHYELNRRISMREAARIQSFPDNFKFVSKLRETERQIGNAVPPVFAWYVANHLLKHLDDSS